MESTKTLPPAHLDSNTPPNTTNKKEKQISHNIQNKQGLKDLKAKYA